MAWTKEQAEAIAAEQNRELAARGAFNLVMKAQYYSEEYGYIVEGEFTLDAERDPIWGPIVAALHGKQ